MKIGPDVIRGKVQQAKSTGVLALRECGLKILPPEAFQGDVKKLRTVDLTSNFLTSLPDTIELWSGCRTLNCGKNRLTQLPESIGLLSNLQSLVLTGNHLESIPETIANLPKLQTLDLSHNRLGRLADDIFTGHIAASLQELDLTGNGLQVLPRSLTGVTTLVQLLVLSNELRELPDDIGRLCNLQYLDAADNQLTDVPAQLFDSTGLSMLWLKGNPIERLDMQKKPGFDLFLARRKERIDAKIESKVVGKVDISMCGLD